jgi:hypothetical protein
VRDGDEAALGHRLRVEAGGLLFHGPVRPTHDERRVASRAVDSLRHVEVGDERDAQAIAEGHLAVLDALALRKRLVPGERALRKGR